MVRKWLQGKLARKQEEQPKSVSKDRRYFVLVLFADEQHIVLEEAEGTHRFRKHYLDEADDLVHRALQCRRKSDMHTEKVFERDHVEWHPVILHLEIFGLGSNFFDEEKCPADVVVTPIGEHRFAEKLAKLAARNLQLPSLAKAKVSEAA